MKKVPQCIPGAISRCKVLWTCLSFVLMAITAAPACTAPTKYNTAGQDTLLAAEIKKQLLQYSSAGLLEYPASVTRFYQKTAYGPAWIVPQQNEGQTWQAMLLIDCVLQFGLNHADYHPNELSYTALHQLLEAPTARHCAQKARFDIMLTDALITFINHLHYGKLNPYCPASRIMTG